MYRNKTITIVIPCYNEEKAISSVLKGLPSYIDEVIVVDNGSIDKTAELARSLGAIVVHEERKGYGYAYKKGLLMVKGEIVATIDGDGTYAFSEVNRILDYLIDNNLDFVSGDRLTFLDSSNMNRINYIGNCILSFLVRMFFSYKLIDSQSGTWVSKNRILKNLNLTSNGMSLSEEIKIEAISSPFIKFREIPIRYQQRIGESKLNVWKDGIKNLLFLFKKKLLLRAKRNLDNIDEMQHIVKQANREFFDSVARDYNKITSFIHKLASINIIKILKHINRDEVLDSNNNKSLLDLCCGTGFFTSYAKKYFKFSYGVDISLNMLKEYRKISKGICADVCRLPFKDNIFDVVSCSGGLHHIYNFESVFKEAFRLIKSNGFLYIESEIDRQFTRRFSIFMKLYRLIWGMNKKYLKNPRIDFEKLELAEYHNMIGKGLDANSIKEELLKIGFCEIAIYHYCRPKFLSPFFAVLARKK